MLKQCRRLHLWDVDNRAWLSLLTTKDSKSSAEFGTNGDICSRKSLPTKWSDFSTDGHSILRQYAREWLRSGAFAAGATAA